MKRSLMAGAVLVVILVLPSYVTAGASSASTVGTGTIAGTAKASSPGGPLSGVCVTAFDVNGTPFDASTNSTGGTTTNGKYKISNLTPGQFAVLFIKCSWAVGDPNGPYYVPGLYKKHIGLNRDVATPVTVTAGATFGVSETLQLGGGISVHVIDSIGNPVNGAIACPLYPTVNTQNGFCV